MRGRNTANNIDSDQIVKKQCVMRSLFSECIHIRSVS